MEFSLEQIEEYARQRERQQRNRWNREHPEKVMQQRIRTAANLLRRHDYTVIKGKFPPPPWSELQVRALQQAILANQGGPDE